MLAFAKSDLKGGNLYILSVEGSGDHKPTEIFRTELQVSAPRFSPDGKYLSYSVTDKANKSEIYVRAVDAAQTGGPWKISDGSSGPAFWRADGKELAYTGPDRSVMVATVATTPSFTFTKPKPLFRPAGAVPDRIAWISRDAERFVALPQPRTQSLNQITIFDRQGKPVQTVGEPGMYSQPAFSPDGKQLSVVRNDLNTGHEDIWTIDVASGKRTRITDDAFSRAGPQWSRDGKHILYASGRNGDWGIYRRAADGSGKEELLFQYTPGAFLGYNDISPDGKYVIAESGGVILAVPLTGKDALARQAVEYLREEFSDGVGRLSPDGGLMAYRSDELQAERGEIFVRPFNSDGTSGSQKWQVSKTGAAAMVHWRADGKELFYRRLDLETNDLTVMAVDVATTPQFKCGAPKALFKLPGPIQGNLGNVSPDGQRFVFAVNVPETTASASGTAATAR